MLTEQGCRARRGKLWRLVAGDVEWIVVTEPRHLNYLSAFAPSPFVFNSQNASGALILGRDGTAILVADNVQEPFLNAAFAGERVMPVWYRCVESASHRAELVVRSVLERLKKCPGQVIGYEATACPAALADGLRSSRPGVKLVDVDSVLLSLRRTKEADEVQLIKNSLAAATSGLRAAMQDIRPGATELDVYRHVQRVAGEAAGRQVLVYGDFVSGPRCEQIGGVPSERVIQSGELVLLDFSAVIDGYRGDFCNTFVCGGRAGARQREMFEACLAGMQAGERELRAGALCRRVFEAVRGALAERRLAEYFPHHAGHGVGLGHPEAPYLVPESSETLLAGDVVTLEPGLYIPGTGGMRYERNYLLTATGYENLSDHPISIDA
ncbi:MAG: aminopeptidase P family protein [Planctomycetia bacterium]|nr:aminopeptidase P family protein [Planctomycetia bacterium]